MRSYAKALTRLAEAAIVPLALASVLSLYARYDWRLELLTHFRPHYLALACAVLVLCLARRHRTLAFAAAAILCLNGALVSPQLFSNPAYASPRVSSETPFRVVAANLFHSNTNYSRSIQWLTVESPDIAVLSEVGHGWKDAIESTPSVLPNRFLWPSAGADGLAILSRHPLRAKSTQWLSPGRTALIAEVDLPGGTVTVIAVHPHSPVDERGSRRRDEYLARVIDIVRGLRTPVLVAGDFNTTPWSPAFEDLESQALLRGGTTRGTWPTHFTWFGVAIDHILAGGGATVSNVRTGPNIGSDHLPVLADFVLLEERTHPSASSGL